ncbi:hypothetical protein DKX38_008439 [Salix brachista]|uniref:Uncharacterized protein n=1 Tax=Salix brachista TaxID=2182728 RepID=A0A5N5MQT6_9ROSI|nr:hypothetical protein DKX38_008439 [Salix brachista]
MSLENTSPRYDETIIPCSSLFREVLNDDENLACVKSSLSAYEDEKLLISQHLKVLERKLHQFASHGGLPFMANSDYSEEAAHGGLNAGESLDHEGSQTAEQTGEDNSSMQGDSPVSNGSLPAHGMSNLNGRLEALEFDRNFLEHAFNSLQSGKEGLQFVQEIAHHLQELWKMGMRNSSWSAP